MTDDPRLQFPDWAKTPMDRALFYVMTAKKHKLSIDFDTVPDDVRDIIFRHEDIES